MSRPFHGFFNFWRGQVRENLSPPLEISKTAKLESDWLKTNENITPQGRTILQTFVWREGGGGWGKNLPPTIQTSGNFCIFAGLYFRLFKMYHFQNCHFTNLKELFSVALTDFPCLVHIKSWTNRGRGYCFRVKKPTDGSSPYLSQECFNSVINFLCILKHYHYRLDFIYDQIIESYLNIRMVNKPSYN